VTRPAGAERERHPVKIGIWGSTGSGKTTFLGALKLAAEQTNRTDVSWSVVGDDELSTSVLTEYAATLAYKLEFPAATLSSVPLRWNLLGARQSSPGQRRPLAGGPRAGSRPTQVEFALELLDLSGQLLDDQSWSDPSSLSEPVDEGDDLDFDIPDPDDPRGPELELDQAVKHVTDCQGILYLFDPIRDERAGDAYRWFNAIMSQIQQRTLRAGRMLGPKLPHHFAFCVTKFDDPEVLRNALTPGELEDLKGKPPPIKLDAVTASGYIDKLARERPRGTARLVRNAVREAVLPERLKFYATSSVGFWWGPDGRFDPTDFANVLENGGSTTIRGSVRPMNVLEPMVWLASHIRKAEQDGQQT
jgi:hypothetical protein